MRERRQEAILAKEANQKWRSSSPEVRPGALKGQKQTVTFTLRMRGVIKQSRERLRTGRLLL